MILNINPILSRKLSIEEVYFSIKEGSKFLSQTISALYMPPLNVIVINQDWLIEASTYEMTYYIQKRTRNKRYRVL
jgi:uncharacterized protein involved in propanediol utilization